MENPKLDLAPSMDGRGPEEKIISTQKISVSDHINSFQYTTDNKSDSFVIDMESFSHGGTNKETNPNSRITRSLSRKGSQRGDKKIITPSSNSSSTVNDRDSFVAATSSPIGCGTPEKPTAVAVGSTMEHGSSNPQLHQITITTGNITSASESRFGLRRSGSRRSPPPWQLDPKRILLFFATLDDDSSMSDKWKRLIVELLVSSSDGKHPGSEEQKQSFSKQDKLGSAKVNQPPIKMTSYEAIIPFRGSLEKYWRWDKDILHRDKDMESSLLN